MLAAGFVAFILAAGPVLEAPWACEQSFSCTQGNGGATSHTGVAQYAWDFGLPLGTEIHAAHGGTVALIKMDSFSGGCDPSFANAANYVVIDHGDGTHGLYLHVEGGSSDLQVGDPVATGDVIARVGQTGWTCGPHLHFQVQEPCASWWCQSVPAEFFGAGAIAYGESMVSENCGECTAALDGGQTTISESEVSCFDRLSKWWWDAGEGLDGHHWFTYATAAGEAETLGRWRFSVTTPGEYSVEVHVPSQTADASGATYAIHHAGLVDYVGVNQGGQKGWQLLGSFGFDGLGEEYLELPDNTGEPEDQLIPLAFDSVRFTYVSGGDGDGDGDPGGDGDGDGDGDPGGCTIGEPGCMCTMGGGCDPGAVCVDGWCTAEPAGDDESGSDESSGDESGSDESGSDELGSRDTEDGCACAATRREDAGPRALLLLCVVAVTSRRRRVERC